MELKIFTDFFTYKFLSYALVGGVLSAMVCSLLSPFVVLQKMAFIGQGISHAAFGGIALALLLRVEGTGMYIINVFFCLLISTIIWLFSEKRAISEDSGIGIFLSVSMAFSILFISFRKDYASGIMDYLFGSILAITPVDIIQNIILLFAICAVILIFFKEFSYIAYDKEMAYASGINAPLFHLILLSMVSLTVVISMKIIGIVLLTAFLILPGVISRFYAKSLRQMMIHSSVVSVSTTLIGLILSNALDVPSGASIVIIQFLVFLVVMLRYKKKNGKK